MSISKRLNISLTKSINAKKSLSKQIIEINDIISCMTDCVKMGIEITENNQQYNLSDIMRFKIESNQ